MTVPTPPPPGASAPSPASGAVGPASATAARDARLAWIIGGSLFIAYGVVVLVGNAIASPIPGFAVLITALWGLGFLVFAFGIRRSGSVVARKPLGIGAMLVAGLLPAATIVLWWLLPVASMETDALIMVSQTLAVVSLAATLVATVVIARAGAVPRGARWVPLAVFAVAAGAQILVQQMVTAAQALGQEAFTTLYFGSVLLTPLAMLVLGILALVLAPREPTPAPVDRTVHVYGPPSD